MPLNRSSRRAPQSRDLIEDAEERYRDECTAAGREPDPQRLFLIRCGLNRAERRMLLSRRRGLSHQRLLAFQKMQRGAALLQRENYLALPWLRRASMRFAVWALKLRMRLFR